MRELTNLLAFLGLVLALLVVWRQSWRGRLGLFKTQSAALALLSLAIGVLAERRGLIVASVVFAVLKVWIIPRVLKRVAAGSPARSTQVGRSAASSLLIAGVLVVAAFAIMRPITSTSPLPTADGMPLAFAMAMIGLLVCVTGRDVLGHIFGFLLFENGVFTLALLATYGLPGLVEAGVFLDVLVIVLIVEGIAVQMRDEHDSLDVDRLRELRG
jgi:hydrogenase-4 component E